MQRMSVAESSCHWRPALVLAGCVVIVIATPRAKGATDAPASGWAALVQPVAAPGAAPAGAAGRAATYSRAFPLAPEEGEDAVGAARRRRALVDLARVLT